MDGGIKNIVIVTGRGIQHSFLCDYLCARHNVVAILHPAASSNGRAKILRARLKRFGLTHVALNLVSRIHGRHSRRQKLAFSDAFEEVAVATDAVIHENVDVHSRDAVKIIRECQPDLVIALGGPVYPRSFIDACPLMLNYHSGVSPFYNGTSSISFAFANGHPHLCGGTLMEMSPVVDGGRILAHYLPSVNALDTPETLFAKTTRGAATLYDRYLSNWGQSNLGPSIKQPKPLFYYIAADWNIDTSIRLERNVLKAIAGKYLRDERIVEYWAQTNHEAAKSVFDNLLLSLLCGTPDA